MNVFYLMKNNITNLIERKNNNKILDSVEYYKYVKTVMYISIYFRYDK